MNAVAKKVLFQHVRFKLGPRYIYLSLSFMLLFIYLSFIFIITLLFIFYLYLSFDGGRNKG